MQGKLIVIEGLDGSGKATQIKLLKQKLNSLGKKNISVSFPDYESNSSAAVKMYLSGEIGTLDSVNVFAASSFYSIDRYISFATKWKNDYEKGTTILCDRYTTSNLCHQMSKLPPNEWEAYISWLYNYEFNLLKIPKPDLVIYLDMSPETSQKLITKRYNGNENKKDLHESNFKYLKKCREAAIFAAEKANWQIICCNNDLFEPLCLEEISNKVFEKISSANILEDLC